tara:strand:+ start:256 stop:492 length:237 start_codon:yes stop_codon:yes gene_type:complete
VAGSAKLRKDDLQSTAYWVLEQRNDFRYLRHINIAASTSNFDAMFQAKTNLPTPPILLGALSCLKALVRDDITLNSKP